MGDPSHVVGLPQDVGTSKKNGIFPRMNTTACAATAPITQSFCDDNDRFCDSGNSTQVHISYVERIGVQAAQFIVGKINGNTTSIYFRK
jgi:acetylxylan esterase